LRFLLVIAGVQHEERVAAALGRGDEGVRIGDVLLAEAAVLEEARQLLGLLDRRRAHQHRLMARMAFADQLDDRLVLLGDRAIDLVVGVLARHRPVGRDLEDVQLVDVHELGGFRRRRAGHAGQLLVEAEIVLEGDRGERLVLGLDRHLLLGFQRLVQAVGIAPAFHHASRELVDDHDLAVLDDVVAVLLEDLVRLERLVDVVDDRDVGGIVEIAFLQQPGLAQPLLHRLVAVLGQLDVAALLLDLVVRRLQARHVGVDGLVHLRQIVGRPGNDQRRARFVDQDRVDLVDDREMVAALRHLVQRVLHVVAQIVEAVLVVGAVGDVAGIGGAALLVVEAVDDDARRHAELGVDAAHPAGVAAGEVVVHRDDVDALAFKRVEIDGQGGDQRLAFARLHLRDRAFVQHHAADQLGVEMALAERAGRRLAHRREGLRQQLVQRLALGEALAELDGLGGQLLVAEGLELRLQRVDRRDPRELRFQLAVVLRPENPAGERSQSEHVAVPVSFGARPAGGAICAALWGSGARRSPSESRRAQGRAPGPRHAGEIRAPFPPVNEGKSPAPPQFRRKSGPCLSAGSAHSRGSWARCRHRRR